MREKFILLLEGGPWPGKFTAPSGLDWPMPDEIIALDELGKEKRTDGNYVKFWESEGEAKTGSLRGAKYKWTEDEDVPIGGGYL